MKTVVVGLLMLLLPEFMAAHPEKYVSPLSEYSKKWDDPKYKVCNTAEHATYMTQNERQLVYILNLARMNPRLFCQTVVKQGTRVSVFIDTTSEEYYGTLVKTLTGMEPLEILMPDSLCTVSARCHAVSSGKSGYTGHSRQSEKCRKTKHYFGECCNYGSDDPLEIILLLLQDSGVESLGHRKICLGSYSKLGVAIERHKSYGHNAVMDFY